MNCTCGEGGIKSQRLSRHVRNRVLHVAGQSEQGNGLEKGRSKSHMCIVPDADGSVISGQIHED